MGLGTPSLIRASCLIAIALLLSSPALTLSAGLSWPSKLSIGVVVSWDHYMAYEEYHTVLEQLEDVAPNLVDLYSIGYSWLGRDIWAVTITDESVHEKKTGVLVVGCHHGREHISAMVPLYIAWSLVKEAQGHNQTVASLLKHVAFYIVPILNPDGLIASLENPWHRKNLRPVDEDGDGLVDEDPPEDLDGDGTIYWWWNDTDHGFEGIDSDGDGLLNEDWLGGVDLNRNYGFHWNDTSVDSGSSDPGAEAYVGPGPFSEPETRAMRDFVLSHSDIELGVSYHSGAACVLYPWFYTHAPCPDEGTLAKLAAAYGSVAGLPYRPEDVPVRYTCSGTWGDWMYAVAHILPLTVEVYGMYGNWTWWEEHTEEVNGTCYFKDIWAYFNPPAEEIKAICQRNYQALLSMVLSYLPPEQPSEPGGAQPGTSGLGWLSSPITIALALAGTSALGISITIWLRRRVSRGA